MTTSTIPPRLFELLDKAEKLAGEFSGGYSYKFDSADDFHQELQIAIQKLKDGDNTQLAAIYLLFLPTSDWDTFVGRDGMDLANEIDTILTPLVRNK